MNKDRITLRDVIETSKAAEREAQTFYRGLAERFSHLPEISEFWRLMLDEEIDHERLIASIEAQLSEDELRSPEDPARAHKVREFLKYRATDMLGTVRNLDDAYKLAVNLEFSEINRLMEFLVNSFVHIEEERASILDVIERHHKRLKTVPDIIGNTEIRRRISVREGY